MSLFFVTGEADITTVMLKSGNEGVHVHCAGCPRMSGYILNIFIEAINRTRRVRLALHDSGTVKVLRTILVLSNAHDCACVNFRAFEFRIGIVRPSKGAQI
jgi:hypothetical protein